MSKETINNTVKIIKSNLLKREAINIPQKCKLCSKSFRGSEIFQHQISCKFLICGKCAIGFPRCTKHPYVAAIWIKSALAYELNKGHRSEQRRALLKVLKAGMVDGIVFNKSQIETIEQAVESLAEKYSSESPVAKSMISRLDRFILRQRQCGATTAKVPISSEKIEMNDSLTVESNESSK